MQKKIKIPKLSLNHIEEDGEAKDYGEEDLQLRHIKVIKSFLFLDICGIIFTIFMLMDSSLPPILTHMSPGVTGHGFFWVGEAWESSFQFAMLTSFPRSAIQHSARHSWFGSIVHGIWSCVWDPTLNEDFYYQVTFSFNVPQFAPLSLHLANLTEFLFSQLNFHAIGVLEEGKGNRRKYALHSGIDHNLSLNTIDIAKAESKRCSLFSS